MVTLLRKALRFSIFWLALVGSGAIALAQTPPIPDQNCPKAVLSRLKHHRLAKGETLASLAQKYQLAPATLLSFNPQLKKAPLPAGQEILVPPFNGIRTEVPQGATWRDVAKAYGIRADVLFEVNGCPANPKVIFVPGIMWTETPNKPVDNYTGLSHYPLPAIAKIGLDYGWQSGEGKASFFHSGIDLIAPVDTPVLAAAAGTVLLVSQEGPYGFLVIIDHGNGRQTRYAHLSRFNNLEMGQKVESGQAIGFVGITGRPDIREPHLHFEVRFQSSVGWVAQDPKLHLPK